MKKITLFLVGMFAFFAVFAQNNPFQIQSSELMKNFPEKLKPIIKTSETVLKNKAPLEQAYALDSMIFYFDTSGTFQAEKFYKTSAYSPVDSFPVLVYSFNRNFDTLERFALNLKYLKDLLGVTYYYYEPTSFLYYVDSVDYKIYDNGWKDITNYYYVYNDVYQSYYVKMYRAFNYDQSSHQYTGGYKYIAYFDDNNFWEKAVYYDYDATNDMWNYSKQYLFTTDEQGRIISSLQQNYDLPSSSWVNEKYITYHYNSAGKIDTIITQTWDDANNSWLNQTKEIKTLAGDTLLTEDLYQTWLGDPNNVWMDDYKYVYEYDQNGNDSIFEKLTYNFLQGTWTPEFKYLYTYNDDNLIVERIYQVWDNTTNQLKNNSRNYYEYDENGRNTLYLYQQWDDAANNWLNNFRALKEYNSTDYLTDLTYQNWDNANMVWQNSTYYQYEYMDIVKTAVHKYSWTNPKGWEENSRNEYYWHSFETGVENSVASQKYIYPNPATDYVYLPVEKGFVKIYSLDGKLIKNLEINGSKLDISGINPGVYTIIINNANVSFTDKLIKF